MAHKRSSPASPLPDSPPASKPRLDPVPVFTDSDDIPTPLFTDEDHIRLDKDIHLQGLFKAYFERSKIHDFILIDTILPLVIAHSDGKLDSRYAHDYDIREALVEAHPEVLKALKDAVYNKTVHNVTFRGVRCLTALRPVPAEAIPVTPGSMADPASYDATEKSWEQDFRGTSADLLHDILKSYMEEKKNYYARYAAFCQSSGTGKSRMNDELAKKIIYIPVSLALDGARAYPPPDTSVREWFFSVSSSTSSSQDVVQKRTQALLSALLVTAKDHLAKIQDNLQCELTDPPTSEKTLARVKTLAGAFRSEMSKGMTFKGHGPYRREFYQKVENLANGFLKSIDGPHTPTTQAQTSPTPRFRMNTGEGQDITVQQAGAALSRFLDPSSNCQSSPLFIMCFDESHMLTNPVPNQPWTLFSELRRGLRLLVGLPFFSLFLSTVGKFHLFTPEPRYDVSGRVVMLNLDLFSPITETGFDEFADQVAADGTWNLARLASTHHMAHLGRALFPARYDKGGDTIREGIVGFARAKLLCSDAGLLEADQKLACLAVRLSLDFRATSWLDRQAERTQVERHMRVCLSASAGFHDMITICPSEPLLAEAASQGMFDWGPAKALLEHIDGSYLDVGARGELIAELLILLARDKAAGSHAKNLPNPGSAPRGNGDALEFDGAEKGRIVTVVEFLTALLAEKHTGWRELKPFSVCTAEHADTSLVDAFSTGHIWFNHFIKVNHLDVINQEYLWRLVTRGAAVICATNQRGIDILVPIIFGTILKKNQVSAILTQVKNDKAFKTKANTLLFGAMDPYTVGLFDAKVESPHPVIRMVFALASTKSGVSYNEPPTRASKRGTKATSRFTAFDIWCAGADNGTFGVIGENEKGTYSDLLLRSQNIFDAYNIKGPGEGCGVLLMRGDARRRMHPGAHKNLVHFEKYTTPSPGVEIPLSEDEDVASGGGGNANMPMDVGDDL